MLASGGDYSSVCFNLVMWFRGCLAEAAPRQPTQRMHSSSARLQAHHCIFHDDGLLRPKGGGGVRHVRCVTDIDLAADLM
jgi:hypothetical protein